MSFCDAHLAPTFSRAAEVLFDSFASGGRVSTNHFFEVFEKVVTCHALNNTPVQEILDVDFFFSTDPVVLWHFKN